jgi:hypothetical protein
MTFSFDQFVKLVKLSETSAVPVVKYTRNECSSGGFEFGSFSNTAIGSSPSRSTPSTPAKTAKNTLKTSGELTKTALEPSVEKQLSPFTGRRVGVFHFDSILLDKNLKITKVKEKGLLVKIGGLVESCDVRYQGDFLRKGEADVLYEWEIKLHSKRLKKM